MAFKLTYFDIRGLAETPRLMFAAAGQEYTDERFSLTFGIPGDFSSIKRPEFDAAKAAGTLAAGHGKVPLLQHGDLKIGQSKTIERYLAKVLKLDGNNPAESALADQYTECVRDIMADYQKVRALPEAEKAEGKAKFFGTALVEWLARLETTSADTGFLVGSKISYADIIVWRTLKDFFDDVADVEKALATAPKITKVVAQVGGNAGVKAWLAKRPVTPF